MSFPLQTEPVPDSVRVEVDGERQDDGWAVEAIAIVFDTAPSPGATIGVRYEVDE